MAGTYYPARTLSKMVLLNEVKNLMAELDYIEIGRAAHELQTSHGHAAFAYATKLAENAKNDGKTSDFEFWTAVSNSLKPRQS